MKKNSFIKLAKLTGNVGWGFKKKIIMMFLTTILLIGATAPGVYFLGKSLDKYLNANKINFNGNKIPEKLCEYFPFNQLKWCKMNPDKGMIYVDYSKINIRDTINEQYKTHTRNINGNAITYAVYDKDPLKNDGEIRSSNLRFEYLYNTIIQKAQDQIKSLNAGVKSVTINTIKYMSSTDQKFYNLDYNYADKNHYESILQINVTTNIQSATNILIPIVVYNNAKYLNKMFNFFNIAYQKNTFRDDSKPSNPSYNQTNTPILSYSSLNVPLPQVLSSASGNRINSWVYSYLGNIYKQFYLKQYKEFNATPIITYNAINNPYSNFVIYSSKLFNPLLPDTKLDFSNEQSILFFLASIVNNPAKPDNKWPLTPKVSFDKNVINLLKDQTVPFHTLFLEPGKSLNDFIRGISPTGNVNEIISFFTQIKAAGNNPSELYNLVKKYPFLKTINFAPFDYKIHEQNYNTVYNEGKTSATFWLKNDTLGLFQKTYDFNNKDNLTDFINKYYNINFYFNFNYNTSKKVYDFTPINNQQTNINNFNSISLDRNLMNQIKNGVTYIYQKSGFSTPIAINNWQKYLDLQSRIKVYSFLKFVNANLNTYYTSWISNLPTDFKNFYDFIQANDIQLKNKPANSNIYIKFFNNYKNYSGEVLDNAKVIDNIGNIDIKNQIQYVVCYYTTALVDNGSTLNNKQFSIYFKIKWAN